MARTVKSIVRIAVRTARNSVLTARPDDSIAAGRSVESHLIPALAIHPFDNIDLAVIRPLGPVHPAAQVCE